MLLQTLFHLRHIHARMSQERGGSAVLVVKQGFQYKARFQIAAVRSQRQTLSFCKGLFGIWRLICRIS